MLSKQNFCLQSSANVNPVSRFTDWEALVSTHRGELPNRPPETSHGVWEEAPRESGEQQRSFQKSSFLQTEAPLSLRSVGINLGG